MTWKWCDRVWMHCLWCMTMCVDTQEELWLWAKEAHTTKAQNKRSTVKAALKQKSLEWMMCHHRHYGLTVSWKCKVGHTTQWHVKTTKTKFHWRTMEGSVVTTGLSTSTSGTVSWRMQFNVEKLMWNIWAQIKCGLIISPNHWKVKNSSNSVKTSQCVKKCVWKWKQR